ncbi:MAG: hypothetical protein CVU03_09105 [Bacteroidetes bacterium HGW-Bacteroidetes-2]|jgi:hypothetical protein|nr:MAG: hypothetical protein CVU03_09105 [Bacteroidetes bacterium HGW-Bacteroidetes-2]
MIATLKHLTTTITSEEFQKSQNAYPGIYRDFTEVFYDLYVLKKNGLTEEEEKAIQHFLETSASKLQPVLSQLDLKISNQIEKIIGATFYEKEWLSVCKLRSTLEALKELYLPYLPMGELMPTDEELDQLISERGKIEGFVAPGITPSNFPDTHWWWWKFSL